MNSYIIQKTIKCKNYLLYTTLILFLAAGFSACSQEKQDKTKTDKATLTQAEPISFAAGMRGQLIVQS